MSRTFNVNADAAIKLTNKLEKLHKSAFPVAVRTTLNSAAFDVKQRTMPISAKNSFTQRKKNFFKANSRVQMAKGFDVRSMNSVVGFISLGGTNEAVDDLEQQERGGIIKSRSFVPIDSARTGKSHSRLVKKKNRLSIMPNVINARRMRGANDKQRFVKAVLTAGVGGLVLSEYKGKEILWRVDSLSGSGSNKFKLTALYSHKKGRSVGVGATHFMKIASLKSGDKLDTFYAINAKKQFKRLGVI